MRGGKLANFTLVCGIEFFIIDVHAVAWVVYGVGATLYVVTGFRYIWREFLRWKRAALGVASWPAGSRARRVAATAAARRGSTRRRIRGATRRLTVAAVGFWYYQRMMSAATEPPVDYAGDPCAPS